MVSIWVKTKLQLGKQWRVKLASRFLSIYFVFEVKNEGVFCFYVPMVKNYPGWCGHKKRWYHHLNLFLNHILFLLEKSCHSLYPEYLLNTNAMLYGLSISCLISGDLDFLTVQSIFFPFKRRRQGKSKDLPNQNSIKAEGEVYTFNHHMA